MKLKKIQLIKFKRFDDLTIDLGDSPKKIIALVGPNGCGKSSVIDAFAPSFNDQNYNNKKLYDGSSETLYTWSNSIKIEKEDGTTNYTLADFYVRSAQRFSETVNFQFNQGLKLIDDPGKPQSSSSIDSRMNNNYNLLMMDLIKAFQGGVETGDAVRARYIDKVNAILSVILDIRISNLADVTDSQKGDLYFNKGTSRNFPYRNLSTGEKAIVDLVLKVDVFNSNIFFIDEPELHISTAIQKKLIIEISNLLPDNTQLRIATHSIGFLRAFQNELNDTTDIIYMGEQNYDAAVRLQPIEKSRKVRQKIFQTPLDDLTGLVAPSKIIYCEGTSTPDPDGEEQGFDARCYNSIFENEFSDILFISSGGCGEVEKYSALAMKVLEKAFIDVEIKKLVDKDRKTDEEIKILNLEGIGVLSRHEIENYLLDKEVIISLLASEGKSFDETFYDNNIGDIVNGDVKSKVGVLAQKYGYSKSDFKYKLCSHITPEKETYKVLRKDIFGIE